MSDIFLCFLELHFTDRNYFLMIEYILCVEQFLTNILLYANTSEVLRSLGALEENLITFAMLTFLILFKFTTVKPPIVNTLVRTNLYISIIVNPWLMNTSMY